MICVICTRYDLAHVAGGKPCNPYDVETFPALDMYFTDPAHHLTAASWDLDDLSVDELSVDDLSVDDLLVYYMSVGDLFVYYMSVADLSVVIYLKMMFLYMIYPYTWYDLSVDDLSVYLV